MLRIARIFYRPFVEAQIRHASDLRLCVVGSGPAGFYTAKSILRKLPNATVHIFERMPVPYGLIRYGVAPDHPEVKQAQDAFEEIASAANFAFFGNVSVGRDVTMPALLAGYHAVVLATGAAAAKRLQIPGSDLRGVYSARDFVGWYNSDPSSSWLVPLLDRPDAVIIGAGNVALDCARILLRAGDLATTDIASYAVNALQHSAVSRVTVAARRGPQHAAFTTAELREISRLQNVRTRITPSPLPVENIAAIPDRARRRQLQLLEQVDKDSINSSSSTATRQLDLRFLLTPIRYVPSSEDTTRLGGVVFEENRLHGDEVIPTGQMLSVPCGLAVESIGYKSVVIPGAPFDEKRAIIPNDAGRVTGVPGLYVAGWLKTGPVGTIASSKMSADETAAVILADRERLAEPTGPYGAELLPAEVKSVSHQQWKSIDAAEVKRGGAQKPREKFANVDDMLEAAN
eukprot:TRINITY_DN11359_c0_g1_i1.p1 TRINITY_DN11359_c0_g1~~TRINITY_DN11359_c0_g1_i1.p1  ORF type:complete len:459 (-),score=103.65 TRINITY_DN11359_c0_g1_i1:27-1403(-)